MNKLCIVFVFLCFAAIASAQLNLTANATTSPSFTFNATFNFTETPSVTFTTNATFNFTETPSVTFTTNATFNFSSSNNQTFNFTFSRSANVTANQTLNISLPATPNATTTPSFSVNVTFNFSESARATANATTTPSFSVNTTFNFTESARPTVNVSIVPPSPSPILSPSGTQEFSLSDTETASISLSATVPATSSAGTLAPSTTDSVSIPAPISNSNTANFPSSSGSATFLDPPGVCGNGIVESGEQCEAKLTLSADGTKIIVNFKGTTCCNTDCQFVAAGQPCRKAPRTNSCLKKGVCDGAGNCGALQPKADGKRCIRGRNKRGVCSNGVCVRI